MKNDKSQILILVAFASFLLSSCSKDELPPHVIAEVSGRQITADDFKRAYIPVLLYSDKPESAQTREEVLNFLIDQTILAQAAQNLHLDTPPTLETVTRTARKSAFTRILYTEWVKQQLPEPSEAELRQAFQRSHSSLLIRHLFIKDSSEARQLHENLTSGANWDSVATVTFEDPSLAANGGVLGWMKFGDMDPHFEDAAFELETGQISEPVQTRHGWHIIRVDAQSKELILTEYDFSLERKRLRRIIRERHENRLSDSTVNAMMDQANLIFQPQIAPRVWTILRTHFRQLSNSGLLSDQGNSELGKFENEFEPILDEEMLRFAGTVWTVKDFLEKLPEMNRQLMLENLKKATAFLVRDELIHDAGLKRDLDQRPDVIGEIDDRRNQFLANLYLRYIAESQPISEVSIKKHYKQYASSKYLALDSLNILELTFSDQTEANELKIMLTEGLDPTDPTTLPHDAPEFQLVDLGWFQGAGSEHPDYYHRLVNVPIKTPVGPLTGSDGVRLILASKRYRHAKPLADIYEQVEQDAQADRLTKLRLLEVQRLSANVELKLDLKKLADLTLD
ncbi:MAG: peptidylprolyl isomerase [Candidatus Marinimicrobia bacterium]|nr:peptidylprolyl isomerase [Candidatus Neomarinimicrobiota bacterium]